MPALRAAVNSARDVVCGGSDADPWFVTSVMVRTRTDRSNLTLLEAWPKHNALVEGML
jgi:hypothetical protein